MNVLITGAVGFIGSHLCEKLVQNHNVVGIDNFEPFYDVSQKEKNLASLAQNRRFTLHKISILDQEKLREILSSNKFDVIFHLAAMAGVRPSIKNPAYYDRVNIIGTVKLLEEARKTGHRKIVFASSSSVYGNTCQVPFTEEDESIKPVSPYGATKLACENILRVYSKTFGFKCTLLRFFTCYGPRQRPDMAIHKFTRQLFNGEEIQIYGTSTKRDYTYIDDIVSAVAKSADLDEQFQIFNIGNSKPTEINELISTIEGLTGKKAKLKLVQDQPGDVIQTFANITKAQSKLHYNPKTTIKDGLKKFVDWFKSSS